MNKQIEVEEMQLLMLNSIDALYFNTCEVKANNEKRFLKEATALYEKGYRKTEDIARDIFAEIYKLVYRLLNDVHYIAGDLAWDINELKKKYESEGVEK